MEIPCGLFFNLVLKNELVSREFFANISWEYNLRLHYKLFPRNSKIPIWFDGFFISTFKAEHYYCLDVIMTKFFFCLRFCNKLSKITNCVLKGNWNHVNLIRNKPINVQSSVISRILLENSTILPLKMVEIKTEKTEKFGFHAQKTDPSNSKKKPK